jgi:energy-coupling factor transporter ATP-binding protein EcfA2
MSEPILREVKLPEQSMNGQAPDGLDDRVGAAGKRKDSAATKIVGLVESADVELFHDDEQIPFATFGVNGHRQTWAIKSREFERFTRKLFYDESGSAASGQAITDALGVLAAKAIYDGDKMPVHFRVAGTEDAIYVDLGDADWRCIEITREGWTVLDHHPVKFRRTGGIGALPEPKLGGSIKALRPFLNIGDNDHSWRLVVAWLISTFRPGFPFPVLELHGEQGSGKSTFARVLRSLIDPNRSAVRVAPRDVDDLMVGARLSWVVAYDNISRLTPSLSDALCRLSTGGGLSKRTLYTDADEVLLDAMRPVILNGIEEVASRSDLLDRAVIIELPTIRESSRRPEDEYWREFEAARPMILGAVCDVVSAALRRVGHVKLDGLPRMADFAKWVVAAEPALGWRPGSFIESYGANRASVHTLALDSSPVGSLLLQIATKDAGFKGTAGELYGRLDLLADDRARKRDDWPQSPRAVSGALTRLASNLRAMGVEIKQYRTNDKQRARMVELRKADET